MKINVNNLEFQSYEGSLWGHSKTRFFDKNTNATVEVTLPADVGCPILLTKKITDEEISEVIDILWKEMEKPNFVRNCVKDYIINRIK